MVTYYSDNLDWRRRGCETGQPNFDTKKIILLNNRAHAIRKFSFFYSLFKEREREKVKEYDKVQEVITIMEE